MRFTVSLPDGSEVKVSLRLPDANIADHLLSTPAEVGKEIAARLTPTYVDQIKSKLPQAAPARRTIERDESGAILGTTEHPAMPSPTVVADSVARSLEPALAAYYEQATQTAYDKIAAAKQEAPGMIETREPTP